MTRLDWTRAERWPRKDRDLGTVTPKRGQYSRRRQDQLRRDAERRRHDQEQEQKT